MTSVRKPAVAGLFYPDDPTELAQLVQALVGAVDVGGESPPKAAVLPHAGYVYSGPVAATGWARLVRARGTVTRVVLIGPSHRAAFRGIATVSVDELATPLGKLRVDAELVREACAAPHVTVLDQAHAREHSLEVHLPFLKVALGDVGVLPLVVGSATPREVAEVLRRVWGGPETMIVVSSDLSHYLDYEAARKVDAVTARAIERLAPDEISDEQACGEIGIRGLLVVAKEKGLRAETVDLRSSGDTAGPRDRVVGYGAFLFR